MSFLATIAKDAREVFNWLGSPRGQAVVTTGAALLTAVDPALAGSVTLAESWIVKIVATETIAAAAGAQTGTGPQKAAAVLEAMTPEITKYFPNATVAQMQNANTALVAFLNAFETPAA